MARHLAPASTTWRRRILGVPVVGWFLIALAGVALAAWLVVATTAQSNFAAQGAGTLNIGNAATTPMFNLTNLQPGDTQTNCMQASWSNAPTSPSLRLYANQVGGTGLADHVQLVIHSGTFSGNTVGIQSCGAFTPDAAPLFSGTLTQYLAADFDYASGSAITLKNITGVRYGAIRMTATLPNTQAVQEGAGGKTATVSWKIEGRGGA